MIDLDKLEAPFHQFEFPDGTKILVCDKGRTLLNQWAPRVIVARDGKTKYVRLRVKINGQFKEVYFHRFLINAPKHRLVDHINGNSLDNRESNLRLASHCENSRNTFGHKSGTSKYKGVSLFKHGYQVGIRGNEKKSISLGGYKSEVHAALVYDLAAIRLHGKFAKTNFPLDLLEFISEEEVLSKRNKKRGKREIR